MKRDSSCATTADGNPRFGSGADAAVPRKVSSNIQGVPGSELPISVLLLVVLLVVAAGFDLAPPPLVVHVPTYGFLDGLGKGMLALPAQRADPGEIDGVAPVVPRPVLHRLDEGVGLAEQVEDGAHHVDVARL